MRGMKTECLVAIVDFLNHEEDSTRECLQSGHLGGVGACVCLGYQEHLD